MHKKIVTTALMLTSLVAFAARAADEGPKIKVGETAPDFTLLAYNGEKLTPVSLHDYRGKKNVALAFFVFAFTGG